jgi:predicted  nucleic acid-binding Zn-ribbon protein
MAVCPMINGACMGMMMPPQVQMEVRRKNKLVIDENSGRIVVDPDFFEEAKKVFS